MKKLRTKFALLALAFGGITLSSCAVVPSEAEEPDLAPLQDREQDRLVDKIFETKYLKANIDVNVAYTYEKGDEPDKEVVTDDYHVTGEATLDIHDLEKVAANVDLSLDMNCHPGDDLPKIDLDFTYLEDTAYVDINRRSVKLQTEDISELIELVLGSGGNYEPTAAEDKTNISSTGIKDIIANIANMTCTNEGDHYKYVSKTTGDQPDLVITSDFDYNITSLAIAGITYEDFTIDVNITTEVLSNLPSPIVSPDTAGHPYTDLTHYFGVMRDIRNILDEEEFGMIYQLALTHYEPDTPNVKVYLGDTTGYIDMDLANSIADISGTLNVSDIFTNDHKAYTTPYHAQYLDEALYLDYNLSGDRHLKLSLTSDGMGDLWELLGDNDVWGGTNIFDLIFGASDKEYPIIDILTDATYRNITKYGSINLEDGYIEVDVDNYLLGGKGHGSLKINLKDDGHIRNITITSLDINSYIVDGVLTLQAFREITPVVKDEYHSLDGIDGLIRDGSKYFQSNKYNVDIEMDIQDKNSKHFTLYTNPENGGVQINIHPKIESDPNAKTGYDGYADLFINDFDGHIHHLEMNANPEEGTEENVYVKYGYQASPSSEEVELKLKATRDSISTIYDEFFGYKEDDEGKGSIDIYKMLAPYIASATKDTLARIFKKGIYKDMLQADYFSVLRDEVITSITTNDDLYTLVFAPDSFGFDESIVISIQMDTTGETPKISYIQLATKYMDYRVNLRVTLKDNEAPIPVLTNKEGYIPLDSLANILVNKELHLDISSMAVNKMVSGNQTPQAYVTVSDCEIDAELHDKKEETDEIWDQLYARISGNVATSGGGSGTTPFILGYDEDNLSVKFGNDAKLAIPRSEVKSIIERAGKVLPKTEIVDGKPKSQEETELDEIIEEDGVNMFLELMQILSDANYADYLNCIKSTTMANPNQIVITIDNSMFRDEPEGTSLATVTINFDSNGINGISLNDFRYGTYSITGSLALNTTRERQKVDVSTYNQVYNIIDAVLNTATPDDVVLNGTIYLDITGSNIPSNFTAMYRQFNFNAFINKENDAHGNQSVYGYLKFENVPFCYVGISQSAAFYKFSDNKDEWTDGDRTFEIYFSSVAEYETINNKEVSVLDEDGNPVRTSTIALKAEYGDKIKEKYITSDDFMNDMTYYLLNYGIGIKAKDVTMPDPSVYYGENDLSDKANDLFNFHNYNIDNNYTPNLSTLLKSYDYYKTGSSYRSDIYNNMFRNDTDRYPDGFYTTSKESWEVTIDGGNLLNNNMIQNVELFTDAGVSNGESYLNKVIITTMVGYDDIVLVGDVGLYAGIVIDNNRSGTISDEDLLKVKKYISSHPVGYRRYNQYNNASSLTA